jgi:nucleotide-binding universal stress UspA family protein
MSRPPVVVATDFSPGAVPAARFAHALGARWGRPVVVGHVVELGFESWWRSLYDIATDPARMEEAQARVSAWFTEATGEAPAGAELRVDHPHDGLTRIAHESAAALLVMAPTSKSTFSQAIVGSRVQEIAARPPCPVAVVDPRRPSLGSPARIMVAVDFSEPGARALTFADDLAADLGAELHAVHVINTPETPALPDLAAGHLAAATEAATRALMALPIQHPAGRRQIITGRPKQALARHAETERIDLLILGRTGHRSVMGDVLGSVPRALIRDLPCTVIVVP